MNIVISGIGITNFGELWGTSPRSLAREAVGNALRDAKISVANVQALFVGNLLAGMLGGQEHIGALFAEELGIHGAAMKIEGACASGGLAVHAGVQSVLSGQYDTVVVLGVEKMTDHKPELVARALMGAGTSEELLSGATFPGLYAMLARAYMGKYKITEEDLAYVAVKNHFHASLNPHAQFQKPITIEQVMKSACIADPLKLLDCSPISDGAAAVVISRHRNSASSHHDVEILASQVANDTLGLAQRKSLTELKAAEDASAKAYKESGIGPTGIDVAEVHDCFTIAEIIAMEDLGFYKKGHAVDAIKRGETMIGKSKKLVVNSSGGLKGCGHPVGATGVKQIIEVAEQLRGLGGKRQVDGARVGLTHNVGGSGATCVVHILKSS